MTEIFKASVGSKTFLTGEYAICVPGGVAVVTSHEPRFTLSVSRDTRAREAGTLMARWLRENPWASEFSLRFDDPHAKKGGFGASSARYLLFEMFRQMYYQGLSADKPADWRDRIADMQQFFGLPESGLLPSGADMVGQFCGNVCVFDRRTLTADEREWPFKDLAFTVFRTGKKLHTSRHLSGIEDVPTQLIDLSQQAGDAFLRSDANEFVKTVKRYHQILSRSGLVATHTLDFCHALQKHGKVLACKGCGAMGADVLLVLCETQDQAQIEQWVEDELGLMPAASQTTLTGGYECQMSQSNR